MEIFERQLAVPKLPPRENESRKKEERGSGNENGNGTSSRELSRPRVNIDQELQNVGNV